VPLDADTDSKSVRSTRFWSVHESVESM
jgi:hypothetical protein